MRALERVSSFWFREAPAERVAALRAMIVGFGLVWLLAAAPVLVGFGQFPAERFEPVGVISPLALPLPLALVIGIWAIALLAGIAALLGWRWRVSGPLFALALLWVTSYRNSWGMIFHAENLLVMHALVLAVLPAADVWSLDARRSGRAKPTPHARYGWGPMLMATLTATTYLIAGVAKLRNAGLEWLDGDVLLGHVTWDNLRKLELGDVHSPIGAWLAGHAWVFAPLAWISVALELGAPLALLHRRIAAVWAIGMWSFHVGVLLIMAILFAYPVSGIAFAPFFAVERAVERLAGVRPLRRLFARAGSRASVAA
ncbi:HTTM domain-containing protein [Nannocystaceae bacterium ST9]